MPLGSELSIVFTSEGMLAITINRSINDGIHIPRWLVEGRTVLIPNTENDNIPKYFFPDFFPDFFLDFFPDFLWKAASYYFGLSEHCALISL